MPASGIYYVRGKAYFAKVLGRPVDNFNKDGKEWTIEIEPDDKGEKLLKELGLSSRITKGEKRNRILFRQREKRPDGETNRPITVVDANNKPWDESKLIGNESVVDLKFKFTDYGKGKPAGVYPQALRVLEHVEYKRQEFAPLNEDDQYWKEGSEEAPTFEKDFGLEENDDLDDEVIT